MGREQLQKQRFELKYVITEDQALGVRDFVHCYLDVDENGIEKQNLSYPVHSLYLDSDQLSLYKSTINGDRNRFKLRIRFYDDDSQTPVFLEIKRRRNNVISKGRAGVTRRGAEIVLTGQYPDASELLNPSDESEAALLEFTHLVNVLQARPIAHVAYQREAWILPNDNSVRVTMDRDVRCEPDPKANMITHMEHPVHVFGNQVILELKFTDRFPNWFRELVEAFHLMQCGAAKYVDGVTLMEENQRHPLDLLANQMELSADDPAALPFIQTDHLQRRRRAVAATF